MNDIKAFSVKLERTLCCFDIEGTGLDVAKDRIVEITMAKFGCPAQDGPPEFLTRRFNPGFPMSEEVMAVHGITNELVAGLPGFVSGAKEIYDFIEGCDLTGFNLVNYDVPLLWEEFFRAGLEWDLAGVNIVDVSNIFRKKEERTLSAAVQFYLKLAHEGAHEAKADVVATMRVLEAQLHRYSDLGAMDLPGLAQFSRFDERVDLAGKIVRNKEGEVVYNIGKCKGIKVADDPSFANWMLAQDFPAHTKMVLRRLLFSQQTIPVKVDCTQPPSPVGRWRIEDNEGL